MITKKQFDEEIWDIMNLASMCSEIFKSRISPEDLQEVLNDANEIRS